MTSLDWSKVCLERKPPARVAVVAHRGKALGDGLPALRERLDDAGVVPAAWIEVDKSKKAPGAIGKALSNELDLLLVWGGDGTVQRSFDALVAAGAHSLPVGVLPAGTANLLAGNLGIPIDLDGALEVAFTGLHKRLDLGVLNDERFAVMAGTGFDALMIRDASGSLKDRVGRAAYVVTGVKNIRRATVRVRVDVDGATWFEGNASCVLLGNVGRLLGGVDVFARADPADGLLEVGVLRAKKVGDWARLLGRAVTGNIEESPLVETTRGRKVKVKLARKTPYELDGGDREPVKRLKAWIEPHAVTVCVPDATREVVAR